MVGEVPLKVVQAEEGILVGIFSQRGEERVGHPSLFPPSPSLFSLRCLELLLDELVKGSATCHFFDFQNET